MAQSKKSSTKKPVAKSSSKSSAPKKKSTPRPQEINPPEPVIPIRRELGAVLFLFLALFTGISYFRDEGAFVQFFSHLIKGLVGWGYWVAVPAFVVASFILFFHQGRPVALRVFCTLLIPILVAAIISLLVNEYDVGSANIKRLADMLFDHGQELNSAGVLGGLLAIGLEMAFSIYGAFPVLIVLLVFCCICARLKRAV